MKPARYRNAIVPHIYVDGAAAAIGFYQRAFGAVELFRITGPHGRIVHAELSICGSVVMMGDPDDRLYGEPRLLGRCSAGLHLFLDDNQDLLRRAVDAGAEEIQPRPTCFTAQTRPACAIPSAMSGFCSYGRKTSNRPRWNVAVGSWASIRSTPFGLS
ncbi:MAG TPA: hypothetical protein VHW71_16485 [Steroidobacteraceae bacterium]|jgi:uncharacterized glyoxalase superfamily protein PhnB|nr:hypothetical protein [Steroidobacteraceae bacterium]